MTDQPFQTFINYRRSDTAASAHHIFDRLRSMYGDGAVFMDITGIELGVDFTEALSSAVGKCDLFLCLIGKDWTYAADSEGLRRLDDPRDFVRIEIRAALEREDLRILPILLEDALMPTSEELPEEIASIAFRNALQVSHTNFDYALSRLTGLIDRLRAAKLTPAEPGPAQPGPAQPKERGQGEKTASSQSQSSSTEFRVASQLRSMDAASILVEAAELGLITEFGCGMPECLCPEELGGRTYFDSGTPDHWHGIVAHYPKRKEDGGQRTLDNVQLAHNLCARVDYLKSTGRPYVKDLANAEAARQEALTGATTIEPTGAPSPGPRSTTEPGHPLPQTAVGASVTSRDTVLPVRDSSVEFTVADELRGMGAHNILVQAAEEGYLTEFGCGMPECLCPEELGGRRYFDSETPDHWHGIVGHRHVDKEDGGHRTVDNVVLSHKLCDRVNYSKKIGRPYEKDRANADAARRAALDRK